MEGLVMGRNAKRRHRGFAEFTPTADDVDLVLEVFEIPGDLFSFPALAATAESPLGKQWLTPARRQHLAKQSAIAAYGHGASGDFSEAVATVASDAMADGLVIVVTDGSPEAQLLWDKRTAPRLHGGRL
jgi:hypothetical protein